MTTSITTVAVVAILGVLAIATYGTAFVESAEDQAAVEGISLDDAGTLVDATDIAVDIGANVTVTHNGTTLTEGVDYAWNESNGELTRLNNSSVPNGTQVNISYGFEAPDDTTRDVNRGLEAITIPLPILLLAAAAILVVGWLA